MQPLIRVMHVPSTSPHTAQDSPEDPDLHAGIAVCHAGRGEALRLLVTRRLPGKRFEGLWEWPGGRVEPGETPLQATVRELLEETGLQVPADHASLLCQHLDPGPPSILFHVHLVAFQSTVPPRTLQCAEALWLPPDQALGREFPPTNRAINRRIRAWLAA